ncbi:glycoside hydrolase family 30 protein [Reichenbachiella ulvae]|uniref:Glucosylceramidase n=1 Tax=Reichenbachiella ulvae TaxID=2980104 RepID=A0ABT3CX11_9BACT|nr:glycoside hydrolase family 30 beta sandwich domain-containing protein [Reichenbachiella ulvae]MCV9388147.1 glucosylceramidase [Reichenbachiella ulvae]
MIKKTMIYAFMGLILGSCAKHDNGESTTETEDSFLAGVEVYITESEGESRLTRADELILDEEKESRVRLEIDPAQRFQVMDGFGFALTGGSASHLNAMSSSAREALLQELFGSGPKDIGLSYIRISIGASDLDAEVYSYNDLPAGEIDLEQNNFSIDREKEVLIPLLKEIKTINPAIKIMASPWSPPVWMKSNGESKGGQLLEQYYDTYARYFVKYFQAMKEEGIDIDAMTIQNEPLHPGNNPSMKMLPEEQANFIKRSLGPAFEAAGINTKILLYDHNADRPDYPISILDDLEVRKYVEGSAFHLYGGKIDALTEVHNAHPDKGLYFTEQWFGAPGNFAGDLMWHFKVLMIGAPRNWSKNVIEWNLSSAPDLQPHTDGGCTRCLGGITIDGDQVTRNSGYYSVAHASKYVPGGSVRIASTKSEEIPNVCFETPEGRLVMLAINESQESKEMSVSSDGGRFAVRIPAGSIATLLW